MKKRTTHPSKTKKKKKSFLQASTSFGKEILKMQAVDRLSKAAMGLSAVGGAALADKYYVKKLHPKWEQAFRLEKKLQKKFQDADNALVERKYVYKDYPSMQEKWPLQKPITDPKRLLGTKIVFNAADEGGRVARNRWGTVFGRLQKVQKKLAYLDPHYMTKTIFGPVLNTKVARTRLIIGGTALGLASGASLGKIVGNTIYGKHPLDVKTDGALAKYLENRRKKKKGK